MKGKVFSFILCILLISSFLSFSSRYTPYHNTSFSAAIDGAEFQTKKKPKQGYMPRLLGRGTEPLGLKENKTLNQLLGQPQIKWVIRSEQRHILN